MIAGRARADLGFHPLKPGPGFAFGDLGDFLRTSAVAFRYRLGRLLAGPLRRITGRS